MRDGRFCFILVFIKTANSLHTILNNNGSVDLLIQIKRSVNVAVWSFRIGEKIPGTTDYVVVQMLMSMLAKQQKHVCSACMRSVWDCVSSGEHLPLKWLTTSWSVCFMLFQFCSLHKLTGKNFLVNALCFRRKNFSLSYVWIGF